MSKTKKAGAGHYEILFIIPNKFTDDESKKVVEKVEKMITADGGKITLSEYWGKKKLAYKIKQNEYGYYGLFEFDLEGANLAKIDNDLRLSTDVLRHQIVAKKAKTEDDIKREKAIRAKIDSKKAEAEKKSAEKASDDKIKEEKNSKTSIATSTVKAEEKKTDLNELDEKLEGILNADDLI
jgi:small subunit ribosomal protein S6